MVGFRKLLASQVVQRRYEQVDQERDDEHFYLGMDVLHCHTSLSNSTEEMVCRIEVGTKCRNCCAVALRHPSHILNIGPELDLFGLIVDK